MFRSKSWFGGGLWKPKNPHSLEHLKYLYNVLSKNQTVSENNRGLLVETLRSIAEILIWGDQNDSSVFDFFLEKNMLSFFLKIMKQKCGSYVCVQLLQTLNILFENIRNETSLYYLLSNNHVNSIIVHKFDFSDEEVMAYYISFLKTLSLKLNAHTIHFFYNEHTNDFPLYTEAIKFFNHSESMVRIAVRTLTLNVYRVEDKSMIQFIRAKTAAPYFSNLVWFIGNHILELDACVRNDADHQSQNRLSDLVAEHLDHLHYLNDILCLNIADLNQVLSEHLLNKLFIPLYIYSLTKRRHLTLLEDAKPSVSSVVALFLLSQVFLILTHKPLVRVLAWIILSGNADILVSGASGKLATFRQAQAETVPDVKPGFAAPTETLEESLETNTAGDQSQASMPAIDQSQVALPAINQSQTTLTMVDQSQATSLADDQSQPTLSTVDQSQATLPTVDESETGDENAAGSTSDTEVANLSITDEEKEQRLGLDVPPGPSAAAAPPPPPEVPAAPSLSNRPFLEHIFNTLQCSENDYAALFALCLLYALGHNQGVNEELLDEILFCSAKHDAKHWYNVLLVEKLIRIISCSCQSNCRVRLVTLELSIRLLMKLVMADGQSYLMDAHLAAIEQAKEESTSLLRNFYKSEEIFLDMFEDEYNEMAKRPLNVEWLTMDSNVLLPPTGTPMTGIEFSRRLPCGEVERARRAIRVFLLVRQLSLTLGAEPEGQLPLTNPQACVQCDNVLDLNNSDLIACTVVDKEGHKIRRFLVIDVIQLILVEPDTRRLGWGVAKFVGFLQDIEVTGDKDDSRCLHITIHRPLSTGTANRVPLLSARFIFDDHIRCMAAKQRLTKGRIKARQKKMHQIARLLDLPSSCSSPPVYNLIGLRQDGAGGSRIRTIHHRPLFSAAGKVPGFAAAMRRESLPSAVSRGQLASPAKRRSDSQDRHHQSGLRSRDASRDNSPRMPRPRSEEIPLEDMVKHKSHSPARPDGLVRPSFPALYPTLSAPSPSPPPPPTTPTPAPAPLPRPEETSFTTATPEEKPTRRKGVIETV